MNLNLINRKFIELQKKQDELNDYFNPLKPGIKHHIHIRDLKRDYLDEIEIYGFSSQRMLNDQNF
jgi:hypothetical protein